MFDGWTTAEDREVESLTEGLLAKEAEISRLRAEQVAEIRRLEAFGVDTGAGARTMDEWVASTLDVHHHTASRLVQVARADHRCVPPLAGGTEGGFSCLRGGC